MKKNTEETQIAKEDEVCCCARTKERTPDEQTALIHRLNRIEGQIRGIRRMVEKNSYCTDIIIQVEAATAALNSLNKEILSSHIKNCVTDDIIAGKSESVDELVRTIWRLMK